MINHKVTKITKARRLFLLVLIFVAFSNLARAYDLSLVKVEKLQNGLTVLMLEDHTFPLVSTQVLYKAGARNECDGTTGVAHFCEHMSFRATKHFPNTDVVSRIYAVGGEWHGYTWIDQTTYFETVPRENLDLTLQIQADRMGSAVINADELEAERGAVLTELHSYENDPALVLNDAVLQVVFLEHPYRNNTIGWKTDVEKLTREDVANFYHRYYNPSNAVLAIAGDIDSSKTLALVHQYFDAIPAGDSHTEPRTVEPPQIGERRIAVYGASPERYFQIAYHAPAVTDPDFAAFLVLQAALSGSAGVNFGQKEDAEPSHPGTRLDGIADSVGTFFIPTADPYVFDITGTIQPTENQTELEEKLEARFSSVRDSGISPDELDRAQKQTIQELIFDIESTEEAAHQLAYFEGIGGLDVLVHLPDLIRSITNADVRRAAQRFLQPYQRTIGWYTAGETSLEPPAPAQSSLPSLKNAEPAATTQAPSSPSSAPRVLQLKNGIGLVAQTIRRTPTGFLRILIPTNTVDSTADFSVDTPVWGYTSLNFHFPGQDVSKTIADAGKALAAVQPASPESASEDPETRLDQLMQELLEPSGSRPSVNPTVISVAGDLDQAAVLSELKSVFGKLKTTKAAVPTRLSLREKSRTVKLPGKPQSEFGYLLPAPAPSVPSADAYRLLLYILAHDYEGRLGKEMIGRTGLIYYISAVYHSNGATGWISMSFGVDANKLAAAGSAFEQVMSDLRDHPPTDAEVQEAKQSLIGRRKTRNQSNAELSAFYARELIEQGRLMSDAEFEKRVRSVTLDQVLKIVPEFLAGSTAIVDTN